MSQKMHFCFTKDLWLSRLFNMQNYNLCEIGTVKKEPTAFHKRVPLPTSLKDFIYYSGFLIQIYYRYHHYCYFDIFHWPG